MIVELDRAAGVAIKRAETADDGDRLRREAEVLDAARHPGIAERLSLEDAPGRAVTLRMRLIAGHSLADQPDADQPDGHGVGLSEEQVIHLGLALATTLADLHDLGVVHGAVSADHVVVDQGGQPMLCGLGGGRLPGEAAGPTPADDVTALATVLLGCLPEVRSRPEPLRRMLVACARPSRRGPPTARRLAARLAGLAQVRGASEPGIPPATAAPGAPSDDRLRWVAAFAVGALAMVATVVTVSILVRSPSGDRSKVAAVDAGCPPVDLGCLPLAHTAGTVTAGGKSYRIGEPDDPVVVGRWRCGHPLPALLQLASGNVWSFDQWPGSAIKARGRLVGHVDGASGLTVEPGPTGCDRLHVMRRSGAAVVVDPAS